MTVSQKSSPEALHPIAIGTAVERLQKQFPDVSHSSLRFLEREGLIHSLRSTGGHRLYTEDILLRVIQIKTWQREGATLEQIRERLALRDSISDPAKLSADFLEMAESGQLDDARRTILDVERAGLAPETIFFGVLKPALTAVGDHWASGELPVHKEKAISEVCRELVTEVTIRNSPDFPTGPLVIAACVEGERHEIGLRMVYGLLRQRGYRVRFLGSDVDTVFLLDSIRANCPDVVLLSSSIEASYAGCLSALTEIQSLDAACRPAVVLVGGNVTERHAAELEQLGAISARDGSSIDQVDALFS